MMTLGDQRAIFGLLSLPDDVLFVILGHCSVETLSRLAATSYRLARLISHDSVWKKHLQKVTAVQNYHREHRLPAKEQCRLAHNWQKAHYMETRVVHHGTKQMPWIQLDNDFLWASYKNVIKCYRQKNSGNLVEVPERLIRGGASDVGRFKSKDYMLVTGCSDGSIRAFQNDGKELMNLRNCHRSDIHCVDFHGNVIVSGSRDTTVKVWGIDTYDSNQAFKYQIDAQERVWSVAVNPNGETFVVGSSGLNHVSPLRMWHTESGEYLCSLGEQYRYGAGVLDVQFESDSLLYSCGYDTYVRLWDLRKSCTQCVAKWEEPFDSTVYCVRSDGDNAFVSGTARHGMVRLWDKRMIAPVQQYYCGRISSPAYSLAYDAAHLYVALDRGINMLNFARGGYR